MVEFECNLREGNNFGNKKDNISFGGFLEKGDSNQIEQKFS